MLIGRALTADKEKRVAETTILHFMVITLGARYTAIA